MISLSRSTQRWGAPAAVTNVLTTALNSLANSTSETTGKVVSAAIANDAARYLYAYFELLVTYGVAPSAGGYAEIAILPSLDGTNFADGSTTVDPDPALFVGRFMLRPVTVAQRLSLTQIMLPPYKFTVMLRNKAGQTMAATANFLTYKPYNMEAF